MKTARRPLEDFPAAQLESTQPSTLWTSPAFAELWISVGGAPVAWTIERDGVLAAVLIGVEFGAWPALRFQAMPDGCYARPRFVENVVGEEDMCQNLADAIRNHGYARAIIADYCGLFGICPGYDSAECQTALVDISDPDWQPPDAKLRSEIRKADREGIAVVPFDESSHLDRFMELAGATESRHGRKEKYSRAFFERLAKLAARDERVVWLWCEHDGRPAASHIYFAEGDSLFYWQSYYDKTFSFLKPNQHMLYSAARAQARVGARFLNLGGSPGDAEGLVSFKKRWGAKIAKYNCLTCRSLLGRLL